MSKGYISEIQLSGLSRARGIYWKSVSLDLSTIQKSLKKEAPEEELKSRKTPSHLIQLLLPLLPISCTWPTLCSWCAWKWHLNQLLVPLLLQVSQSHLVQLLLSMLHISCTRPTLFPWKWQLGQLLTPRLLQASPTHQGGVLLPQLAPCTGCPLYLALHSAPYPVSCLQSPKEAAGIPGPASAHVSSSAPSTPPA